MPPTDIARSRLRFEILQRETTLHGLCRVSVSLEWDGTSYKGTAEELETKQGVIKAASRAALAATLAAAGDTVRLEMVGVKAVRAFDGWVVVTRLNCRSGDDHQQLLGAAPCEAEDDLPKAAVMAVLDAGNRVLGRVLSG